MKTTGLRPSILPLPIRLIPPEKNGDYAFLLHLLKSLKPSGKGAIILPHGVLFRGNAEARIRTELLNLDLIKGIIGLPANLFYGTGIPLPASSSSTKNTPKPPNLPKREQTKLSAAAACL